MNNREDALKLFAEHNADRIQLKHALAVEAAMRHFASIWGEDADLWGTLGLLHDLDWETIQNAGLPEGKHCHMSKEWLEAAGYDKDFVRAVMSHGFGLTTDVEPVTRMEKTLYTIDELTGFVTAVALVRPSRSFSDLEVSSVKKKWKDKAFARGINRDVINNGCAMMSEPLEKLIAETIAALRPVEASLGLGASAGA